MPTKPIAKKRPASTTPAPKNLQAMRDARDENCKSFADLAEHKLMGIAMLAAEYSTHLSAYEKKKIFYDNQYGGGERPLTESELKQLAREILEADGQQADGAPALLLLVDEVYRCRYDLVLLIKIFEAVSHTAKEMMDVHSNSMDQAIKGARSALTKTVAKAKTGGAL